VRSEGRDLSASDVIVWWAEEGDGSEIVPTFRGMDVGDAAGKGEALESARSV
jgi:hypothetical protein